MSDDRPSLDVELQIDTVCVRFEDELRSGTPRIEDYLSEVREPARARLLAELLAIEAEMRARRGEPVSRASYLARFPEHAEVVERSLPPSAAADDEDRRGPGPRRIGTFRVVRELGRGGQAVVYLAEDERLKRKVALKVLVGTSGSSWELLARFRREAEVTSGLDHPGICAIYETGMHEGTPWIAMRYVEGRTLADGLEDAATTTALVHARIELVEKVARALHAAHEAGVVHRDIKPGNIMITPAGEPVVLDFGLATAGDADQAAITRTGDVMGTPAYMAPEQIATAGADLDRRTDVYALGVILYEALGGRRPFEAPTLDGLYRTVLRGDAPPLRRLNPRVPAELAIVVACAMEKDADRRYRSAAELADDLQRVRERRPIAARPVSRWLRARRWAQRDPALATFLAMTLLFLVVITTTTLYHNARLGRTVDQYDQMSDVVLLDELLAAEERLWPCVPSQAGPMQAWLDDAAELLSRERAYREAIAELEREGARNAAGGFERREERWRHRVLTELVGSLATLAELQAGVERRSGIASTIANTSLVAARGAWERCAAAIAADARFDGLEFAPRLGLVPLGRDRHSGLIEFWHVASGARPEWEGTFEAGAVRTAEGSGIVLVLLPPGTFMMGAQAESPDGPNHDPGIEAFVESPPHEVTLPAFLISKYEVTQAQWLRSFGDNPSRFKPATQRQVTSSHPVTSISQRDADLACGRWGLELPTEAHWEYAARATTSSVWFFGSDVREVGRFANVADAGSRDERPPGFAFEPDVNDGHALHAPVGSYEPNAWGLHDVHGNAWEYCAGSRYDYPTTADHLTPSATDGRRLASSRGGSFLGVARLSRAAQRRFYPPRNNPPDTGLRPMLRLDAP